MVLVGVYAFLTAAAIIEAWGADVKAHYVFLQLPIALQMALITELMPKDSIAQLRNVSWEMAYLVIWPPTALVIYTIGSFIAWRSSLRLGPRMPEPLLLMPQGDKQRHHHRPDEQADQAQGLDPAQDAQQDGQEG